MIRSSLFAVAVLLAGTASARADEDPWVGKQVMRKETAQPQLGNKKLEWSAVPLPGTVEQVNGDWMWMGAAWVRKQDVIAIDDAPTYYTGLIQRTGGKAAVAYALRGVSWLCKREYAFAVKDFDEAVRLEPGNSTYHACRGKAQFMLHQYEQALANFNEAIRLNPANLVAYNDRGATYNAMNEFQRAHDQLNEVLRVDPNNALAYNNRGANWNDRGELDKALDDLNQAIKLDPKMGGAYCNRGRVLTKQGKYPEAISAIEKAIKISPHEWSSYNGWARVLATSPWPQLRDGKRAKELAEHACDMSKWTEWMPIASLAAAYAELGDYEQAIKWQTKAMAMDQPPKETDAKDNAKRLECYKAGKPFIEELPEEKPADTQ